MIDKELHIDIFTSPEQIETGTLFWSKRYTELLSKLGELGTEVQRTRTLITIQEKPPHNFIGTAMHIFVFPPQTINEIEDFSDNIEDGVDVQIYQETTESIFDETLVDGVIRVYYDDSDNRVAFSEKADLDDVDTKYDLIDSIEFALSEE